MSDETTPPEEGDPWWPGHPDPGTTYRHPAFTVQRTHEGIVTGGDYVRGSTDEDLAKTAVRYPTGPPGAIAAIPGHSVLFTRPYDYETVEIVWGLPDQVIERWDEMCITRSAFGFPSTVNDGQVIRRSTKGAMFPDGEPDPPWTSAPFYDLHTPPPTQLSPGLPSGRWYYYSLFFRVSLEWVRSMVSSTLLPLNHHHTDHLWNTLPPYYRWVDENQERKPGRTQGDLQRWLSIFGFDLDYCRQFIDSWQQLYHIDLAPASLLRRLGQNWDLPFESGLGDIRYRGLLAEVGYCYQIRGTQAALERIVQAASKYECDVTVSPNLLTLADDGDFFEGTGNWAGLHPDTNVNEVVGAPTVILAPDKLYLESDLAKTLPTNSEARSALKLYTSYGDRLTDIIVACGDGEAYDRWQTGTDAGKLIGSVRHIYPRNTGVVVHPGSVYGFTCYVWARSPTVWEPLILWMDADGMPPDLISASGPGPLVAVDQAWESRQAQGTAPEDAFFAVPAIHFSQRTNVGGPDWSAAVWITEAQLFFMGDPGTVSAEGVDQYMTLGDPSELIGGPRPTPPFPGYVMGQPRQR